MQLSRFCKVWAFVFGLGLSGCASYESVKYAFLDDEEIAVRLLKPITPLFDVSPLWQEEVGDGIGEFFSTLKPAVGDDKLFVADRYGVVKALSAESGKTLWKLDIEPLETNYATPPVYAFWEKSYIARVASLSYQNKRLYVGTENGRLLAVDAATGNIDWEVEVAGEVLAPASVDEGFVVINTGGGTLYAFDEKTGESKWNAEGDVPPLTLRGISAPIASNGGVIVGTPTGYVRAAILETGLTAWETAVAKPSGATELERIVDIDATPVLFGGMVYVIAYNGTLAAIEIRTGRMVWSREYGAYRDVTLRGNTLYVVDVNSSVYALDRRNGVEKWVQSGLRDRKLTAAVPYGNHVVVGDEWGFLHWINLNDGKIEARYSLGDDDPDESIYADPLVVDNKLIAVTRSGQVAALKPLN